MCVDGGDRPATGISRTTVLKPSTPTADEVRAGEHPTTLTPPEHQQVPALLARTPDCRDSARRAGPVDRLDPVVHGQCERGSV